MCLSRQKAIKLTPEEAIRQLYRYVLTERLHYPISRIQVEYGVNFGTEVKRADSGDLKVEIYECKTLRRG